MEDCTTTSSFSQQTHPQTISHTSSYMSAIRDSIFSTCSPEHLRSARMGVEDWVPTQAPPDAEPNRYACYFSPSTGLIHYCNEACSSWVLRFIDNVKICAISGECVTLKQKVVPGPSFLTTPSLGRSPKRREKQDLDKSYLLREEGDFEEEEEVEEEEEMMELEDGPAPPQRMTKRHQSKALPGSSAALADKFLSPTPSILSAKHYF